MDKTLEVLVLALRSLSREEKVTTAKGLWNDSVYRSAFADLVIFDIRNGHKTGESDPLEADKSDTKSLLITRQPKQTNSYGSEPYLTAKERGKCARAEFVANRQAEGMAVDYLNGQWVKTNNGMWTGIPFATERETDRWFLGLNEKVTKERLSNNSLTAVVLLCQSRSGEMLDFVIPSDLMKDALPHLSKSKGQLKFNLRRIGNRYQLRFHPNDTIDVSGYLHNTSIIT